MCSWSTNVTDRRTDRRTERRSQTVLCTKVHCAVKMREDRGKVTELWRTYRNSPTLFQTVPSTVHDTLRLPFLKIGVCTPTQSSIAIISRTGKSTDFKFGRYIHRVHPIRTKANEQFSRNGSVGVSRDCPYFLGTPYYISNGNSGNATGFKFG